jgi:uncharacterized protein with HEPN domain
LLNSWDIWKKYREGRNETSHTYDETKAEQVFEKIEDFVGEARYLLVALEKELNKD